MSIKKAQPFLKWAGGKRQLLPIISQRIPNNYNNYIEPFIGAGALLFEIAPKQAIINDVNTELVNAYQTIRDDVEAVIDLLKTYENTESEFMRIRALDRSDDFISLSQAEKTARMLFLNKTCYNGLYRVNSKNQFNVPFGKYKNPRILNEENLRAVADYLNKNKVKIENADFEAVLKRARKGDFIYLDPPYDPLTATASFTSYTKDGFDREAQKRLKKVVDKLEKKGCYFLLSNSNTVFINDLYKEYTIEYVDVKRSINADATGRGAVKEVLIRNY